MWEQRYQLLTPGRTKTRIRYYDDQDLRKILNVSFLNQNGLKISHIARMSEQEMAEKVREIVEEKSDQHNQINALVMAMVDMDEAMFEKIISTNSLQMGFERCMIEIVFPFMHRIGILWQTGSINPAHEHFISNLIRQKILVAIDGQVAPARENSKRYVLFLPEGELHELSLLFAAFILKARRQQLMYLGQSLPLNDLEGVSKLYQPHYVFSVFTSQPARHNLPQYVTELQALFPHSQVLLTGYQALSAANEMPEGIRLIHSFEEMIEFVETGTALRQPEKG